MKTMTIASAVAAAALLVSAAVSAQEGGPASDPRIDQIQVVGTHNSYSLPADRRVMALLKPELDRQMAVLDQRMTPAERTATYDEHPGGFAHMDQVLDYVQLPLQAQLTSGARSIELDLQPDPQGGAFADPVPYRELAKRGETDLLPIYREELRRPGLKVLHMSDVDFRSQCPAFRDCLTLLRQWSDANPEHSPVFVLLEPKLTSTEAEISGGKPVPPFNAATFAEIDDSIRTVIGRNKVFAPDDLRGDRPSLEAAALAHAWPRVSQAKGKFLFLFIVPGMNFAAFAPYLLGHENLDGRMAFVQGRPGMKHTAFQMFDNALTRAADIRKAVAAGYLVRTRADIDTFEARENTTERRDAALASGAQIISTDFLTTPNNLGTTYHLPPFLGGWRASGRLQR